MSSFDILDFCLPCGISLGFCFVFPCYKPQHHQTKSRELWCERGRLFLFLQVQGGGSALLHAQMAWIGAQLADKVEGIKRVQPKSGPDNAFIHHHSTLSHIGIYRVECTASSRVALCGPSERAMAQKEAHMQGPSHKSSDLNKCKYFLLTAAPIMAYLHNSESFSRLLDFSIFTAEKSDEKMYQLPCLN